MNNSTTNQSFKTIINLKEVYLGFVSDSIALAQAYLAEQYMVFDDIDVNLVCSELIKSILETSNLKVCLNERSGVVFIGSLDEPLDAVLRLNDSDCLEPYITCPKCFSTAFLDDFTVVKDAEGEIVLQCSSSNCEEQIMKF